MTTNEATAPPAGRTMLVVNATAPAARATCRAVAGARRRIVAHFSDDRDAAFATADEAARHGAIALPLRADLEQGGAGAAEKLIERTIEDMARIDVVAVFPPLSPTALRALIQAAAPHLAKVRPRGTVVVLDSDDALHDAATRIEGRRPKVEFAKTPDEAAARVSQALGADAARPTTTADTQPD